MNFTFLNSLNKNILPPCYSVILVSNYKILSIIRICLLKIIDGGLQAKVPTYLGGVSVFFCFTAALVALALGIAIVPRQVMPWTGLLLMYEWTFTIYSLLFGGYLHLIYQWGKATAVQSGSLSSHSESLDYDSGKGL